MVVFGCPPPLARLELISTSGSSALSSFLPKIEGFFESVHVASSSSRSRRSSGSMGLYPGVKRVVVVASCSVSASGGGWVV